MTQESVWHSAAHRGGEGGRRGGMGLTGREQQNGNQYTYIDGGSGGQC